MLVKIGDLDRDTGEFIPGKIVLNPPEPVMYGVYFDTEEGDDCWKFCYVTGVLDGVYKDGYDVLLGHFDDDKLDEVRNHADTLIEDAVDGHVRRLIKAGYLRR
jgi:hypothetical protein